MIESLTGYRDDNGRLEVEVELTSGAKRVFIVREEELESGCLSFTALPPNEPPSWPPPRPTQ